MAGEAKQLKVHHTTVFRRLRAMEENLGVRLFERLAKGYVLTLSGEKMYQTAPQNLKLILPKYLKMFL